MRVETGSFYKVNIGRVEAVETMVPAILNALTLFSILILVGLGMAIIFGMMGVINLAHGN